MNCPICKSDAQVWDGYCHRVSCEVFVAEAEEALQKYRQELRDETAMPYGQFWTAFKFGRKTDLSAGAAWEHWHEGDECPSVVNPMFVFGHRLGREAKEEAEK